MLTIHRFVSPVCLAGLVLCLVAAACRIDGHYDPLPIDAAGNSWGTPERILNVNTPEYSEWAPSATADHLELYFVRSNQGDGDIFVASRASPTDPWGIPAPVWITPELEGMPEVSPNGLELYVFKGISIWRSVRASRMVAWPAPTELFSGLGIALTGDALIMYYASIDTDPSYQIRKRIRTSIGAAWGPEEPVGGIDQSLRYNSITVDDQNLYIVLSRPVIGGIPKVAEMSRSSVNEPFQRLQELPMLTTPTPEHEYCDMFGAADAMYCDHAVDFVSQKDIFLVTRP